jgi:hypothetical protein
LNSVLGFVNPLDFDGIRSFFDDLPLIDKIRLAYNVNKVRMEKEYELENLRRFLDMPELYNDEVLREFSIVPYVMGAGFSIIEALNFMDKKNVPYKVPYIETDKGYEFYFDAGSNKYVISLGARLLYLKVEKNGELIAEEHSVEELYGALDEAAAVPSDLGKQVKGIQEILRSN